MIGKTLGHFRVVQERGCGGMGEVYINVEIDSLDVIQLILCFSRPLCDPLLRRRHNERHN